MTTAAPEAPVTDAPAPPAEPVQPPGQQQPEPAQPPAAAQPQPPAPKPSPPPSAPQQQRQEPPTAEPAKPSEPDGPDLAAQLAQARADLEKATADAARWKRQSRAQEQRSKGNHEQVRGLEAIVRQMAEKVGVEFDDSPDPAELTRKLGEKTQLATDKMVELAVYMAAADAGASPKALLDSREFMRQTSGLDPDASDFEDQVAGLVAEAAKQDRYKAAVPGVVNPVQAQFQQGPQQPAPAAQAPAQPPAQPQPPAPASGADFSGAPPETRLWTQQDYDYWTQPGRDRDGKIMAKAIADGLLVNLGIGKPKRQK